MPKPSPLALSIPNAATAKESFWTELGVKKALQLFHDAAVRVPAYKDFLKRARVDHVRIRTAADLASVPPTDAKNYIAAYPLEKRCWDGKLLAMQFIATSSGTTGAPKFWPRTGEQDREAALVHEWLYRMYFDIDKRSTLLLIGFPMGIYISGVATLLPSWLTSLKGYRMTVMSIGNNKAEMLRTIRELSDSYQQTILIGHPFFIKDVIETGASEGIAWAKKNIGLMFCSGGFGESWREYIGKKAGIPPGAMRIFNTYGSSEMLLMAYETRFSIAVKRMMEKDRHFVEGLHGEATPPQLFQYDPALRYIEAVENELIFTSASGIPLIRFNLHDRGTVFSWSHAREAMALRSLTVEAPYRLPFVALWGRSDDTLKFNAVNIYPEHIKAGLMDKRFLGVLTGKFVMRKPLAKNMNETLEINVELSPGVRASKRLEHEIGERITKKLMEVNLEYHDMSSRAGRAAEPRVILRPYQDSLYFKPGLKPKFIDRA